ncbi:MAG: ParA family protein [Gammaproteobacteria bacterium SHHR-1]|uniref:ParA family protein n=1 Tax=Magnetovirga frankeli TaxID=947516 RepID=UPI0012935C57|nr:ParA family protein [gamma proteobacterium SS-5]
MKVWAVANQKGGVAKTTTTVALGGLLAGWGFRVLLVDMDPHGSMTSYFRYDPDNIDTSVYNLFQANAEKQPLRVESLICDTGTEGLSLLPASLGQATLDRQAGKLNGMGLILKGGLKQLEDEYDYVLIDCPPLLGVLLINALAACDQLIIPVQTEFLALKGLDRMTHTLKMVLKARHRPLPYLVVPSMYDQRTRAAQDSLKVLRQNYAEHLWPGVIPVDTKLRDASKSGLTPAEFAPRSRAVIAYGALLEYLLRHTGQELASAEQDT